MEVIRFCEIGNVLGTRAAGKNIRAAIISKFGSEKVVLDFKEVEIVSNSFADECIGKLVEEYGLDMVKKHTTFSNVNPDVMVVIKKVIRDRLKDIA